jgi:hypothetical protein
MDDFVKMGYEKNILFRYKLNNFWTKYQKKNIKRLKHKIQNTIVSRLCLEDIQNFFFIPSF